MEGMRRAGPWRVVAVDGRPSEIVGKARASGGDGRGGVESGDGDVIGPQNFVGDRTEQLQRL